MMLELGWGAPKLIEQFPKHSKSKELKQLQKDLDCHYRLAIRGYYNGLEKDKFIKRLKKQLIVFLDD